VFAAVVGVAFSGLPGHERDWRAEAGGVTLEIHGPAVIRSGEFMELRIRVEADAPIDELVIAVDEALWEDFTVNTMIPAAGEEASENGEFRFTFAELAAGTAFLFKVDLQVNPDIVGGNRGSIGVYDGDVPVVATDVGITVLP
jgi:hypothetical protein